MDNENLLNSIYQNIAMVLETIPEIRKITTDCDFKALIVGQEESYQNLSDSVKDAITSNLPHGVPSAGAIMAFQT